MSLHGQSTVAGVLSQPSTLTFHAVDPQTGASLEPVFHECPERDVDAALAAADHAAAAFRQSDPALRALFLETIATEILALGDALLERAHQESGLPLDRLTGERGRTVGQLRLFAEVVREGSWCEARIDTALPERTPLPRPDLRSVLVPLGPVVVFGASNFPLAFSVAGGDTASALAVGCPVVVKGHPAHPGTGEMVAGAIDRAARAVGLPAGVFSFLQGSSHALGRALVQSPKTRAVGFTGSHRGGRALLDAANARHEPIPVFAEMSSLNPVFILPGALRERGTQIAQGLKTSMTMGVGQFCTKPGLVFAAAGEGWDAVRSELAKAIEGAPCATMLHAGISGAFASAVEAVRSCAGVHLLAHAGQEPGDKPTQGRPVLLEADSKTFAAEPLLREELFGPAGVLVKAADSADLLRLAESLDGQLTATIHATEQDLNGADELLALLERKAGRVLLNGFPTGVEVCHAMQHGGPYPATSDSRFTSVGTAALRRWVRPVCYQNFPAAALPRELQNENPLGLMRLVNGKHTREPVES